MNTIEVQNLTHIFGHQAKTALKMVKSGHSKSQVLKKTNATVGINNVTFTIRPNEIFVIMGLSGSGKSTLLRCLNRLITPTEGQIIVNGKDIQALDKKTLRELRKKEFGMVFQNFGLLPYKTVMENTAFGLEVQDLTNDQRQARSITALKKVGLEGWEDKYPSELSGGMRQRVGLARALAVDPSILLMDEPFSALDPLIKQEMQDLLLDLYDDLNKTIVFITHDLDEALKLGDRIAIMKDGEIVQIGTPEDILTNSKTPYVEDFVKNVNRSIVLTASNIMIKPRALLYESDGLNVARYKMSHNDLSSIFVVDEKRRYKGILHFDDVYHALKTGTQSISQLMRQTKTLSPDVKINDISTELAKSDVPFPVLDSNNYLLGILVKATVLENI